MAGSPTVVGFTVNMAADPTVCPVDLQSTNDILHAAEAVERGEQISDS